jgi:hypothetical protein
VQVSQSISIGSLSSVSPPHGRSGHRHFRAEACRDGPEMFRVTAIVE